MKTLLMMLISLSLLGCGAGDGTGLDENGQPIDPDGGIPDPQPPIDPDAVQPNLTSIQEKVLTPVCTQCHAGNNAPLGLKMDDLETSVANLIDIDSATNPDFKRVEPGSPEQSFFYLKIIGDPQAGSQMPLGQTPLPTETQDVIKTWIESGAPIDANQATVASKRIPTGNNGLSVSFIFSQPILTSSLQASDVQLTAKQGDTEWPISQEHLQLDWRSKQLLDIHITDPGSNIESIVMQFNQENISSVVSETGVWLDGNYDGIDGGAVRYEYSINK